MGDLSYAPKVGGSTLAQQPQVAPQATVGKSTLVGQQEEPRAETEDKRLAERGPDKEIFLGTLPIPGGKAHAVLKLDHKGSALGAVESPVKKESDTPVIGASLYDSKISAGFLDEKAKFQVKFRADIAKLDIEAPDLDKLLPGFHVKVDGQLGSANGMKIEGPSVSIVAWQDATALLSANLREKYTARLEIKFEYSVPRESVKAAIEEVEELEKEARKLEQVADRERELANAARKDVRVAKQALNSARNAEKGAKEARTALGVVKPLKKAATETARAAEEAAERLCARAMKASERLAVRILELPIVERAVIRASETVLAKLLGKIAVYLIPGLDFVMAGYDLYNIASGLYQVYKGRARFALSDPDGEFRGALEENAAWAAGFLSVGDGPEFHPTKEQAEELNAAVPKDLSPDEQEEIKQRYEALAGKGDDWTAACATLRKVIAEVRAKTRAPVAPEQLDATDTNPGAQRVAAELWGSGILSQEEYKILCRTIPADLTNAELERLRPYLQKRGDKADVRLIAGWIAQIRAGQKITLSPPGPSTTPVDKDKSDKDKVDGGGGGGAKTKQVVDAKTSGGGGGKTTPKKAGGGGGGKGNGRGGTTPGVLVPVTEVGTLRTPVHFALDHAGIVAVGSTVPISVYVPALRISRTMYGIVLSRKNGATTVQLVLATTSALEPRRGEPGPIIPAHDLLVFRYAD